MLQEKANPIILQNNNPNESFTYTVTLIELYLQGNNNEHKLTFAGLLDFTVMTI